MIRLPILGLTLACIATAAGAVPVTVTSLSEFQTQVAGASSTTETFGTNIAGGITIVFDGGAVSTLSGGDLSLADQDNLVIGGAFEGVVDGDGDTGALLLTWDFGAPVVGFGADFAPKPGGFSNIGIEVSIDAGTTFIDLTTALGGNSGFFGLIDFASPFQTVRFRSSEVSFIDGGFSADNLVTSSVPLPAGLPFLLTAIAALALVGHRRRTAPAA